MSAFHYRAALLAIVVAAHASALAFLLSYAPVRANTIEPARVVVSLITPPPVTALPAPDKATLSNKVRTQPATVRPAAPKIVEAQSLITVPPTMPGPVAVAEVSAVATEERVETPAVVASAAQRAVAPPRPVPAAPAPVVPPSFDAGYLNNPPPAYPPLSRRMREEGRVVLRVFVNERGLPDRVELRTSSGHVRLDEIALDTVKQWRFVPARRGEAPIGAWVLVPIAFNLRS